VNDWTLAFCLPHGLVPNGMTTWALNTASHLARRGWRVQVLAHEANAEYLSLNVDEVARAYDVDIQTLPAIDDAAQWQALQQAYARVLPAVFFPSTVEHSYEHVAALSLHRLHDVRCVGWNHLNHAYEYEMLQHFLPVCGALISNTADGFRRLFENGAERGIDVLQTHHLPCPLSMDSNDASARHDGADRGPLRIAYAGRFEDTAKRVSDLFTIAEELARRDCNFILALLGSGPLHSKLKQRADDLNASAKKRVIEIREPLPPHEMSSFWRSQDALLLASAYEGQSMQLMEAMRHGCVPVLSRGAAAGVDLARDNETALLFDVGKIDQAADRLQHLAQRSNDRIAFADRAQAAAMTAFDPALTLDQLEAILRNVIQRPSIHWPIDLPISMRAAAASNADDENAIRRFQATVEKAKQSGYERVAIYGAGRHTRALAPALAECPLDIRCIIDDDATLHGTRLWGWPIVGRAAAVDHNIDAVILSSKMNEAYLLTHLPYFESHGINVFALYTDDAISEKAVGELATPPVTTHKTCHTKEGAAL